MARVLGVDPQVVVVHVDAGVVFDLHGERLEGVAAVLRAVQAARHQPDPIFIVRVDPELAVVHRTLVQFVHARPRLSVVAGLEDPALLGLHDGHDQSRVPRRDGEPYPSLVPFRQAFGHLVPRVAAVRRPVDAASRPAAREPPRAPAPLVRRRVEHRRVRRVEGEVDEAGVVVDVEDLLPRLAAVRGPVDAALGVGAEQVPQRRHPHDVGVRRVDGDAPDVARLLQPCEPPRLAAVRGVIHALAPRRAVAVVRFPGTDPHLERVGRGECDIADREVGRVVEDRRPRRAVVHALPHAARGRADIDVRLGAGHDFEIVDAPPGNGGPDQAPGEPGRDPPGRLGLRERGCRREPELHRSQREQRANHHVQLTFFLRGPSFCSRNGTPVVIHAGAGSPFR